MGFFKKLFNFSILDAVLTVATMGLYSGVVLARNVMSAMMPTVPIPDPGAVQRTMTGATAYRRVIYGERVVGGQVAFWGVVGHKQDILHLVVVLAGHECEAISEVYLNDKTAAQMGVTVYKYLGTADQAASPQLMATFPTQWTADHRLQGLTYVHLVMAYNQSKYPGGIPSVMARVKGRKVYDPRTGVTAWSNNNALCCRDWLLLSNKAAAASRIDDALVIAAANRCDELINGVKRHTCNGVLELSGPPKEGAAAIAASMGGVAYYRQGKWRIYSSQYEAPVATLSESDLAGPLQIVTRGDKSKTCNIVRGEYYPATEKNIATDFPPVSVPKYIAEDLEELPETIKLPFTDNAVEAQRLAKLFLMQSRNTMAARFPAKFTALRIAPFSRVALNIAQAGWSGQVFRVNGFSGGLGSGVVLDLIEDDAAIWDWTPGEETVLPTAPATTLPDPYSINPPDNLLVTESSYSTNTPGVVMAKAVLSWDSGDIRADRFVVMGKGPGDAAPKELGTVDAGDNTSIVWDHYDPKPGAWVYYVSARSALGVPSTAASYSITIAGTTTPPATVSSFAVSPRPGGIARLTWAPNAETNILDYSVKSGAAWSTGSYVANGREIRATSVDVALTAAGAVTFWVKARNTALLESATAASVTFTPSLTTPGAFTITPGIGVARIEWADTADAWKAGYEVQIAPDVSGAPGTWATKQKGLATGYTYTGTPGTPAWVRVRTYDTVGNVSAWNSQTQFTPDYVKALDSAHVPTGYNLQINSDFDAGTLDGWQVSQWGSLPTVVTATTPRSGKYAARNPANTTASIQGVRMVPCNPDRAYILEAYAATVSGATGTFYLRVYFYTAAGAATTPAYLSAAEAVTPGVTPTFYSKVFGAGQTDALPSGAVYMRPVVILNYNNGDRIMETQGVRIREMIESLYVKNASMTDADILNVSAGKVTSGSVTSQIITLALTEGAGDVAIKAGKSDFGDPTAGIILGMDDSDGNLPKLEIGDAANYLKYRPGTGLQVAGSITITDGSGYGNLTDRPTSLGDINVSESNVLGSVQPGATNTLRYTQATDPIPLHPTFSRASAAYLTNGTQIASGKPRIEPGKFGGAIMAEEGTSNLLLPGQYNASDTTLFSVDTDCVLSLETTSPISGASSIKCVTPAVAGKRLYFHNYKKPAVTAGLAYSGQMLVKGSGTVTFGMRAYNSSDVAVGDSASIDVTLTATPQLIKIENFIIPTGGVNLQIIIGSKNAEVCTIIADCYQIEAKPYATSFIDGTRVIERLNVPAPNMSPTAGTIEIVVDVNSAAKRKDGVNFPAVFMVWQDGITAPDYGGYMVLAHSMSNATWRFSATKKSTAQNYGVEVSDSLTPDGFNTFTVKWDQSNGAKLFINGVYTGATIAPTYLPDNFYSQFEIGHTSNSTTRNLNTTFDSVRLSNIARTDAEILASATSGLPMERDAYTTALFDFNTGIEWLNGGVLKTYNGVAWEDAATWGAPTGTYVGLTPAEDVESRANSAYTLVSDIASDSKLTPVEKQDIRREWDAIYSEKSSLDAQATALGITTEKTTYDNSIQALGTYLNGGTAYTLGATPPSWITDANLSVTTTIVGATFRSTFKTYYDAKIALINKMAAVAATKADWTGVSGTGKPADYATKNTASSGTTPHANPQAGDTWFNSATTDGTYYALTSYSYNGTAWIPSSPRGTYITSTGLYTGLVVADKIQTGVLRGINVTSASYITKGSHLTQACAADATTLYVQNTADFSASGSGWIYDADNDKDEISWTGKTDTTLTGVSGVLAHTVNAIVVPKAPAMTFDSKSQEFRILGYNTPENTYSTVDQLVTLGIKDIGDGGTGTTDTAIARFGNQTHSRGLAAYFENNKASSSTFTAETVRIENFNFYTSGYTSYGLTVNNCHYNGTYDSYAVGIFTRGIKYGLHAIIGGITGVIPGLTDYAVTGFAYGTGRGGVFESVSGDGVWGLGTNGVCANGNTRDFYATGPGTNYASFTGSHDALVKIEAIIDENDIVEDICIVNIASSTQTISEIGITNTIKSTKVFGVMGSREKFNQNNVPVGLKVFYEDSEIPDYDYIENTYDCCLIHALGEGVINVCKDGGNILAGDYICTSSRPGKGMKQDDDLLHNYTVAKAREDCTWAEGEDDIRMIACTYHCG